MTSTTSVVQSLTNQEILQTTCTSCNKRLAFGSLLRHKKTQHKLNMGKVWTCNVCGKVCQSEKRLSQHENIHKESKTASHNQFHCDECPYRTIVKAYLGDHVRIMHKQSGNGMFMCVTGKCALKPLTFPNQQRLDKHSTCHANVKCSDCEKIFSAKRNLTRHTKSKHGGAEDDPLQMEQAIMEADIIYEGAIVT